MKTVRLPRAATLVLFLTLSACGNQEPAELVSGETFAWSEVEGHWLAVNYWAEWCKPCYEEIPELNALDRDPRVSVFGVNYDELEGAELRKLIDKMDIQFANLTRSPAAQFGWDHPVGLPATFLVNPAGELVEARFGPQTRDEILAVVERGPDMAE